MMDKDPAIKLLELITWQKIINISQKKSFTLQMPRKDMHEAIKIMTKYCKTALTTTNCYHIC